MSEYDPPEDVSPQICDLIKRMLTVDVNGRITLSQIKTHPGFTMLTPGALVLPKPLPLPLILESIEIQSLDPSIPDFLKQIGLTEADLQEGLSVEGMTQPKHFIFLLIRGVSFDSLPWGDEEAPQSSLYLDNLRLNFGNPFDQGVSKFGFYLGAVHLYQKRTIERIAGGYDRTVIIVQKHLIDCGFLWYYPHDQLILARRKADMTDLMIRIEFCQYERLRLVVGLASADDLGFVQWVDSVSKLFL
jgi:hypothetical protein